MDFNFDEWKRLFETDPEEAERRWIAEAPPERQENLRRLQERIDMVRVCYKDSPIASCNALNQMLMDRVCGAGGLVSRLEELSELLQQSISAGNEDGHSPQSL